MDFSEVAIVFDRLESKSGRLEMTDILAELFKKTKASEIDKLVYIMQGILLPPYEDVDLGVGERLAIEAISNATGYPVGKIDDMYKRSGDLGDTAEELVGKKKQTALMTSEMEVSYVYGVMMKIARAGGSGSQQLKIKYLTELLNNANPVEARFIVRYVLAKLRLGVGDPTILDALSVSHAGDKSMREEIERAYNVCSDLGLVSRLFFEDPKNIEKFKVTPFKPLMPALAERLSSPEAIIEKLGKCAVEMKYDGFRLQVHKSGDSVEIYSRKLEKMTHMFPDVIEEIKKLKQEELIFEGEALAYNEKKGRFFSFQQTMHRRRKHGIDKASKDFPLQLFVFDIMYDGRDLTNEKYSARRRKVKKFKGRIIRAAESKIISSSKKLEEMFQRSISSGLEGIMAKDLDAPYTAGKRKFAWIKLKKSYGQSVDTVDAVIVGYYLGQGHRAEFEFGGVLVAVNDPDTGRLKTVAKVASGFTEEEMVNVREMLEEIKTKKAPANLECTLDVDYWVEPKYVIEVAFDEISVSTIHTAGYALRFPRFVKMRDDKSVNEITTSKEIEEMIRA